MELTEREACMVELFRRCADECQDALMYSAMVDVELRKRREKDGPGEYESIEQLRPPIG